MVIVTEANGMVVAVDPKTNVFEEMTREAFDKLNEVKPTKEAPIGK